MVRSLAAYIDLDPGLAPYFMAGQHDDMPGASRTYYFLGPRGSFNQVAGSSMMFILLANAALTAILLGTFLTLLGWSSPAAALAGFACGLAFAVASSLYGYRMYSAAWRTHQPLSPTPDS